jgi:hypothetical protein
VDRWLLRLAEAGTVADLDRDVRHWARLEEQERGVDDYLRRLDRRAVRASRTYDGMVVVEVVLIPAEEGEEALILLDGGKAVDGGSCEPASVAQRRADALMDLLRAGQDGTGAPGSDRYTLHRVADVDAVADRFGISAELLDGGPLSTETLRRLSCDCGVVRRLFRGGSQPLDVGTRTPVWTTAQRRSISLRDRGQCRFVACQRRTCDIHHVVHYETGGPTAVANGSCCARATTRPWTSAASASAARRTARSRSTDQTAASSGRPTPEPSATRYPLVGADSASVPNRWQGVIPDGPRLYGSRCNQH